MHFIGSVSVGRRLWSRSGSDSGVAEETGGCRKRHDSAFSTNSGIMFQDLYIADHVQM